VAYAPLVGWAILLVAVALLAFAIVRARRIETFPWTDVLRRRRGGAFRRVGGCAVLHLARAPAARTSGSVEQRFLLAQVTRWAGRPYPCSAWAS